MAITKEERARRDKLAEQGIKVCSTCKEEKPFSEFNKCKTLLYGLTSHCKSCFRKYYKDNKERMNELARKYNKQYYQKNKECIKEAKKQYRQNNKEKIRERAKQYYQDNKEKFKGYKRENKERLKQYREENKEKLRRYIEQYHREPENIERRNKRLKERRQSEPMYKLSQNMRSLVSYGFKQKGWSKDSSTQEIIGCSWEQVVLWLGDEPSKELHIDHVIPQSLAETPEELKLLNHYTNFQLLKAEENLSKGNRYIRKHNLNRVLTHHPQPDKLKEIVKRSNVEII